MENRTLSFEIVTGFLVMGSKEPIAFAPQGRSALRESIALEVLAGDLPQALEELLELTYHLDGKGDAPEAARSIRAAMVEIPEICAALGIASEDELRSEERRRARLRAPKVPDWRVQRAFAPPSGAR